MTMVEIGAGRGLWGPCLSAVGTMGRAASLLALVMTGAGAAADGLPVAPVRPVMDTHFGVQVSDPYRYMEATTSPEVQAWMKAHSDYAHRALQALPERAAFRARLEALEQGGSENINRVQARNNGSLFYLRRGTQDRQFQLMWRRPGETQARLLFDPMAVRLPGSVEEAPRAINGFSASPHGVHVGVLVSAAGLGGRLALRGGHRHRPHRAGPAAACRPAQLAGRPSVQHGSPAAAWAGSHRAGQVPRLRPSPDHRAAGRPSSTGRDPNRSRLARSESGPRWRRAGATHPGHRPGPGVGWQRRGE
ncbi:MAG: hypothetical protein IPJ08_25100 [Burkholderiales bacterium]|nr:hypothetical protein [Burkholderiales bacterium]